MFTAVEAREFIRYSEALGRDFLGKSVPSPKVVDRLLLGGIAAFLGLSADQQANWQQDILSDVNQNTLYLDILASPRIDPSEEIMISNEPQVSGTGGEIKTITGSDGVVLTKFSGEEGPNVLPVLVIPKGFSSEELALLGSQKMVEDLWTVSPLQNYKKNLLFYMHNQGSLSDLECYRDSRMIPICSPDKVENTIEHAMIATNKTILEAIVLWNVDSHGAGSTINLDRLNPPSYRSFAVLAFPSQRSLLERRIAANEIGKSIFGLTEEFVVDDSNAPVGNTFFNCREDVSLWVGLPGNPGTQFEGCYTQKTKAYRTSEKNVLNSLTADSFGILNGWYMGHYINLVPGNYAYPPFELHLYRTNPVLGKGFPQGSLDLGIKPIIPDGTRNMVIELIPAPDRETGIPNSPGVGPLHITDLGFIDKVRKEGFVIPAPKPGVGPYVVLPGMGYTWKVRVSPKPNLSYQDGPDWETIDATPILKIPNKGRGEVKDFSAVRGSEKISFPLDGKSTNNLAPILQWLDGNTDVFYYEVQVSSDPTFEKDPAKATAAVWENLIHGGESKPLNSWQVPAGLLEPGKTYYMRAKPRVQGDGISPEWSTIGIFKTSTDAKVLSQRELEVIRNDDGQVIDWQAMQADHWQNVKYAVQQNAVAGNAAFIDQFSDPVYGIKPDTDLGNGAYSASASDMEKYGNVTKAAILDNKGKVADRMAYRKKEDLFEAA